MGKKEAVRLIPDIIISDVMMPEIDGFTLCKYLKNDIRTSHIPIILLTAKGDLDSKLEGLRQGADDYVVKPFTQEELLARIQSLLLNRKILHQRYALPKMISQSDDHQITQEDKFMENIQEIIQNNIDNEHLDISLLCKDLGMSKAQLYRKFKPITNHTIASYIRIIRLHKAKSIIENTTLNVTQAAISVGISNVSRFSRIFKKEFGLNPKEVKHLRSTNTA